MITKRSAYNKADCTKMYPNTKPLEWKRYIDDVSDVFSLWETGRETINRFVLEANTHHPTIKFMAEISEKEITFPDTTVFKGERFYQDAILDDTSIPDFTS